MIDDADGVVAVAAAELPSIHSRCGGLLDREASTMRAIEAGTLDPARFDDLLRQGLPDLIPPEGRTEAVR
ncbi:hypothetical protein [Pseudomonas sp.]|uniref:hypothetical protein n=1 Tax=Pseudomonas sp. TaxID=306 RepID=UPI003D0ED63D